RDHLFRSSSAGVRDYLVAVIVLAPRRTLTYRNAPISSTGGLPAIRPLPRRQAGRPLSRGLERKQVFLEGPLQLERSHGEFAPPADNKLGLYVIHHWMMNRDGPKGTAFYVVMHCESGEHRQSHSGAYEAGETNQVVCLEYDVEMHAVARLDLFGDLACAITR